MQMYFRLSVCLMKTCLELSILCLTSVLRIKLAKRPERDGLKRPETEMGEKYED